MKKTPKKKKTFVFECYNLMNPMELKAVIFEVHVHQGNSKILQLLVKFSYFGFWRKWFLHLCQKLHSLVKKTQGILGVNP
jgi:hypothetical protein